MQRAGVIAAAGKPEIPGLPATEWGQDTKRALHIRGHLIHRQRRQVVTVSGEAPMGIRVAGQLKVWVGGNPAGDVWIALDPFTGQEKRRGGMAALQLVDHLYVGIRVHLAGSQQPQHRVGHVGIKRQSDPGRPDPNRLGW